MPAPFPHHYSTTISRTFSSRASVEASPHASLQGGPSAQFDGDVGTWSPEQLMLSSLGLCMLTTFEAFAARDGIQLLSWNARSTGTVERTPEGLMFTSIVLCLEIEITGSVDSVESTLEEAKRYCLVLNALRVPVVIEAIIRAPGQDDAEPLGQAGQTGPRRSHAGQLGLDQRHVG